MENHPKKIQKKSSNNIILWISLSFLAAVIISYFIFPGMKAGFNEAYEVVTSQDEARIKIWVKQFGTWGPIVLILAMTLQMFMLIIPNVLLFIIAILCYGPIWGSLICITGVFASSSLGFIIGKKLGPAAIDRFVSARVQEKIALFVSLYGTKAIAIARLSSMATDALGFAAGILEMQYKKFMMATMSGVIPVIVLIAIFGKSGKIEKALLWIAGISIIILIVYITLDRKKHRPEFDKQTKPEV